MGRKGVLKDFKTKKAKVGRKIASTNATKVNVKTKKIWLPGQRVGSAHGILDKKEFSAGLSRNLKNPSAANRIVALSSIRSQLSEQPDSTTLEMIATLLPAMMELLFDEDSEVREALVGCFLTVLQTFGGEVLTSNLQMFVSFLCSALSNLNKSIRKDAMLILQALAVSNIDALQPYKPKIMNHVISILNDKSLAITAVTATSPSVTFATQPTTTGRVKASGDDKDDHRRARASLFMLTLKIVKLFLQSETSNTIVNATAFEPTNTLLLQPGYHFEASIYHQQVRSSELHWWQRFNLSSALLTRLSQVWRELTLASPDDKLLTSQTIDILTHVAEIIVSFAEKKEVLQVPELHPILTTFKTLFTAEFPLRSKDLAVAIPNSIRERDSYENLATLNMLVCKCMASLQRLEGFEITFVEEFVSSFLSNLLNEDVSVVNVNTLMQCLSCIEMMVHDNLTAFPMHVLTTLLTLTEYFTSNHATKATVIMVLHRQMNVIEAVLMTIMRYLLDMSTQEQLKQLIITSLLTIMQTLSHDETRAKKVWELCRMAMIFFFPDVSLPVSAQLGNTLTEIFTFGLQHSQDTAISVTVVGVIDALVHAPDAIVLSISEMLWSSMPLWSAAHIDYAMSVIILHRLTTLQSALKILESFFEMLETWYQQSVDESENQSLNVKEVLKLCIEDGQHMTHTAVTFTICLLDKSSDTEKYASLLTVILDSLLELTQSDSDDSWSLQFITTISTLRIAHKLQHAATADDDTAVKLNQLVLMRAANVLKLVNAGRFEEQQQVELLSLLAQHIINSHNPLCISAVFQQFINEDFVSSCANLLSLLAVCRALLQAILQLDDSNERLEILARDVYAMKVVTREVTMKAKLVDYEVQQVEYTLDNLASCL